MNTFPCSIASITNDAARPKHLFKIDGVNGDRHFVIICDLDLLMDCGDTDCHINGVKGGGGSEVQGYSFYCGSVHVLFDYFEFKDAANAALRVAFPNHRNYN